MVARSSRRGSGRGLKMAVSGRFMRLVAVVAWAVSCSTGAGNVESYPTCPASTGQDEVCVGAGGGDFALPGGVTISVPPGALSRDQLVTVSELATSDVDRILLQVPFASHHKRALRGFSLRPDGLTFASPIRVRFTVPRLGPGELPVPVTLDRARQAYRIEDATVEYDGASATVEMRVAHFSEQATVVVEGQPDPCKDPSTWRDEMCGDPVQPRCCSFPHEPFSPGCDCCRELGVHIVSLSQDDTSGACRILSDMVKATYPYCADPATGQPPYVEEVPLTEVSAECRNLVWTAQIEALEDSLPVCTVRKISASLIGRSGDGRTVVGPSMVGARWAVDPAGAATVEWRPSEGSDSDFSVELKGLRVGSATVTAEVQQDSAETSPARASRTFSFACDVCGPLLVYPSRLRLKVGHSATLTVIVLASEGKPADPSKVTWSSDDDRVAYPGTPCGDPLAGSSAVTVTARKEGFARITSAYDDGCQAASGEALVEVTPGDDPVGMAAGDRHTCAIVNGGAWCWGANENGQLGDNSTSLRHVPVRVTGLTSGVQAIAASPYHTCAVVNGGAWCWGRNTSGQLGDGSTADSSVPVQVTGLASGVEAVTAGAHHSCAVVDGGAWCWGGNGAGQLGDGTGLPSLVPVQVKNLGSGVQALAASYGHSCAAVNGGALCWGYNTYGQLGDGSSDSASLVPVQVGGLTSGVEAIAADDWFACAIVKGGVECWGRNTYSAELGVDGHSHVPMHVADLASGATAIAVGPGHSCAIVNGGVRCWGFNYDGRLGNGSASTDRIYVPQQVVGVTSGAQAIAAGTGHSCAVVDGTILCWGDNISGQLGDGSASDSWVPVPVRFGP